MNRLQWICLAILLTMIAPAAVDAQQMVYLVRHGQKLDDGKDPSLSPAGEARAARLAAMLSASGVNAIYTTQFQRTRQHAAPLARALAISPVIVSANDTAGLLDKIASHGADGIVLVVGHSNTVPAILRGLGYGGEVKIDEAEFDNLFVLVPKDKGAPALVRLKY